MAELTITTVAERPEYIDRTYELNDAWPEFMGHDKLANALFNQVPSTTRRSRKMSGARTTVSSRRMRQAVSALEIAIDVAYTGRGLSHTMLSALREAARKQGNDTMVAPVRPNAKHLRPDQPMTDYLEEVRDDGLPKDPWLRVHARAGARIVKVAPASMVMAGSLEEWRAWTGLPFDQSGEVFVPEALVPVRCDLAHGYAVYVEPNVWVHHDLTG